MAVPAGGLLRSISTIKKYHLTPCIHGRFRVLELGPPRAASDAIRPADHHLAADQARSHAQPIHGLDDERIARCPVMAAACDQPDSGSVTARHKAEAIVLYFMETVRTAGRAGGLG
jgi:hypothetical protein